MKAYQQRVLDERCELDEKRRRLVKFIDSKAYYDLSEAEKLLLVKQANAMEAYSTVLGERIAAFNEEEKP